MKPSKYSRNVENLIVRPILKQMATDRTQATKLIQGLAETDETILKRLEEMNASFEIIAREIARQAD